MKKALTADKGGKNDSFDVQKLDLGRYTVRSQSTSARYVVDLLAFDGFGRCDCSDWQVRCGPARRDGKEPDKPWCKHIGACRTALTWEVIHRLIAIEKENEEAAGE